MRFDFSWYRMGLALVTVLAACAPGDRSNPNESPSTLAPPAAAAAAGTILLQEAFEDNSFAARGWYDNNSIATTAAQHVPGSARALELHWTAGSTTPTSGGATRHLFTPTPTLYVNYWVKYSANWVGSGKGYHPHQFLVLSDQDGDWDGPSNNWLTTYIEDNYQNGGIPRLALQDNKAINTSFGTPPLNLISLTENRSVGGCNGLVEAGMFSECFNMPPWYNDKQVNAAAVAFKPTPGPGYKGDWNEVEVYFQMNSIVGGIGQANGVMQYWFNGALVIDRHDVLFRTGARPNIKFHQFLIGAYIGDGSPVDQYMWVDNLTLATARAGTTPPPDSVAAVATVTVAPGTVSQAAGATQQLVATLRDAAGNILTGRSVTWTSSAPAVATVNATGLETGVAGGTATITATSEGKSGTATITVASTKPGAVTALSVSGVSNTSVTLSFTEVNDGTGQPAKYDVRSAVGTISWGSATSVTQGTCQTPVAGTTIGAVRTCTVLGLAPSTSYQFQLIPFRGTLNVNAVFGPLSNAASGTTAGTPVVPVASVTIAPASASLAIGATQQLTATLKDANGNTLTGRAVTWTSSNPSVASLSANGAATGASVGTATITATSEGKSGTAALTITAVPVATVTVSPSTASAAVGATQQLAATLRDAGGNTLVGRVVTWTSSSPSVATVSGSGLVTGVAAGTATITATCEGQSGTAALTITNVPVATVTVSPASASLLLGATQQLAATLKDAAGNTLSGRPVTWSSSSPSVATVSGNGLVTGVAAGTATVTATSEGKSGTAAVTVTATVTNPATVTNVAVTAAGNNSVTLSFTEVNDGTGQPAKYDVRRAVGAISWGSATEVTQGTCSTPVAGTAIGAVRTCTVLGLAPSTSYQFQLITFRGTLNVNAVFGGLSNVASGTTTAVPVVPVATVSIAPTSASVATGQTVQLTATPRDASGNALAGRVVTWGTSNASLAPVSGSGLVSGMAAGLATITATSEGQNGTAPVTVTQAPVVPVATVTVNPTSASVVAGQTVQLTATPRDASGNALAGRVVTWGSSNTTVATVASGGLVTAKVAGTATITATSEGKSGTSAVTVTAVPPPPPPPSGNWPNEPAGMTVRNDYGWTDNIGSGNIGSSGWATNGGNASRVDDATAPYSPSSVMEIRFPVGFTGGVGPINAWYDLPGADVKEIYVGFWWKVSNPWQGHPSNVNKIGFITTGGTQDGLVPELYGSSAPYKMRIAIFELGAGQNPAYGGWLDNNVNNVTPTLGVWHRVEIYAKYGTSSTSNNGIVKLWMDGSLLMNYSDINFAHAGFDGWKIAPTWGGIGSTKTQNDFYWFDHVHTSTR